MEPSELEKAYTYDRLLRATALPAAPHIGHSHHLCTMCKRGDCTLEEFKELVRNPKFICKVCGRAAANEENLCEPVPL